YIFPNTDDRHFNIYFLGGVGVVSTSMTLTDPFNIAVKQDFTEFEAHLGVGTELRFHWFALRADFRGVSLWRSAPHVPAAYYADVEGAPVPKQVYGFHGTLGASIWF